MCGRSAQRAIQPILQAFLDERTTEKSRSLHQGNHEIKYFSVSELQIRVHKSEMVPALSIWRAKNNGRAIYDDVL